MDVTPRTLREVEFREKMRGYHPEDVDQFLEEVAAGVEVMQERMRQALERAQRAEAAASEAGGNDEALRKTLVLAQRTADLAVQEARDQAARILAGAEQQAQGIIADAEEQRRRTVEDATEESRSELARLEISRAQAQEDVDTLSRWLDEHKAHLVRISQGGHRHGGASRRPVARPLDRSDRWYGHFPADGPRPEPRSVRGGTGADRLRDPNRRSRPEDGGLEPDGRRAAGPYVRPRPGGSASTAARRYDRRRRPRRGRRETVALTIRRSTTFSKTATSPARTAASVGGSGAGVSVPRWTGDRAGPGPVDSWPASVLEAGMSGGSNRVVL